MPEICSALYFFSVLIILADSTIDGIFGLLHSADPCHVNKVKIVAVTNEKTVVTKTQDDANRASAPYFAEKRAVVAPMGMAERITAIPRINGSTDSTVAARRTDNGIKIKRTMHKGPTPLQNSF